MQYTTVIFVSKRVSAGMADATIIEEFLAGLERRRGQVAVRRRTEEGSWHEWTFGEVADMASRVASGLRDLGVQPGDRVLLMMRNIAEFHVADLAVLLAGAVPVSIYNSSSSDQIAYLAGHAGAGVAIVEDRSFADRFTAVRDQLPLLEHVVTVEPTDEDKLVRWTDLLAYGPIDVELAAATATPHSPATIIYTSGTTGTPKGVVLTHANVVAQLEALRDEFAVDLDGARVLSYLPMAHIAERAVSHYGMLVNGLEVSCLPDVSQLSLYLSEVRPQILFGVPRVWEKIRAGILAAVAGQTPEQAEAFPKAIEAASRIAQARSWGASTPAQDATWSALQTSAFQAIRNKVGLDQVQFAISGAAPLMPEVSDFFNAIGVPLSDVYGLSESTGAISWSARRIKPGTVGRPVKGVEIALAEDGEVIARGETIFGGYLDDAEKTAEMLDDGWLRTGDIGEIDDDGYLKIVDRKKELIITAGGKNISPANLEAALKTITLVGQAFAVGDNKPYTAALVVLDPEVAPAWASAAGITFNSLTELAEHPAVISAIESELAGAMTRFNSAEKIKRVRVLGTEWLPDSDELTPTSKLKRRVIREKYATEIDSLYG